MSTPTVPRRLVEIRVKSHDEIYELCKLKLTIVGACSTYVKAILNDNEIARVRCLDYNVAVIFDDYTAEAKKLLEQGRYHTYQEVVDEMITVANTYPDITRLDTLGYSVEGRVILGLKVSDNPEIHEFEPGIRLTGCHHGEEHIAKEIVLYMIHYLTRNYSIAPMVKGLVDTREIWLIPMMNPDGVAHSVRENANGVDLNRDYGYMWEGWGGSPAPFSQPETQAMRRHTIENKFTLELDYHSVDEKVNTVWDYTPIYPQHDTIIMNIGKEYAESTGYELIRGYYWFEIHGSCQDAMYGCEGIISYTIETPQPVDLIPVCEKNCSAILGMIKRAGGVGIAGIVRDSITGTSIDARIDIQQIRWPTYTNPMLGDYHCILLPGTYIVEVYANGYLPKVISGIVVNDSVSRLDIALTPGGGVYAHRIVWATVADPNNAHRNYTLTVDALGPPDGRFISLGVGGDIVVDMGENTPITDSFRVYEGDDGIPNEGYEVQISNNWNGPFDSIGTYYGTQTFYVSEGVRYVRIKDDGDGDPDVTYAGFDLDAIESYWKKGVGEKDKHTSLIKISVSPNPFSKSTVIRIQGIDNTGRSYSTFVIYDISGRVIREWKFRIMGSEFQEIVWDGKDSFEKDVRTGIYFCKLILGEPVTTCLEVRKIIRVR